MPTFRQGTQSRLECRPFTTNSQLCTLITFEEDLFYLCCASAGKALNKYFAYFLMTMNGINHTTDIVLQLMFTF